jgi:hypothetical protein
MHEMLTQTEEVLASGPWSGGEERNKRLEMLVCDLLRKNQNSVSKWLNCTTETRQRYPDAFECHHLYAASATSTDHHEVPALASLQRRFFLPSSESKGESLHTRIRNTLRLYSDSLHLGIRFSVEHEAVEVWIEGRGDCEGTGKP